MRKSSKWVWGVGGRLVMSQLKSGTVGIQNFRERERETAASLRDGGEAPPRSETPPDILLFFNNTHTHTFYVLNT